MAAPGWYPDPTGRPIEVYWDGMRWTDHQRPWTPAFYQQNPPPAPGYYRLPVAKPRRNTTTNVVLYVALAVAVVAVLVAIIHIATEKEEADNPAYQLGYRAGSSGTARTLYSAGVDPANACSNALTMEYMFKDESFQLDQIKYGQGCRDALGE